MIDEHFFPRGLVKPLAHFLQSGGAVEINGKKAEPGDVINDGDHISYKVLERTETESFRKPDKKTVCVNVTINGKPEVLVTNKTQCLFVDVFNNIEIDFDSIKGVSAMLLNGNKASFTDVINDGDVIELHWKEK